MRNSFPAPCSALVLAVTVSLAGAAEPALVLRDVPASGVDLEVVCGSHTAKTYIIEQLGGGGALFDHDGDGDLDLYVGNGARLAADGTVEKGHAGALYRHDGPDPGAWHFVDVTANAGLHDAKQGADGWGVGAAAADVDGDGDTDLYVTRFGPNVLYENQGDGTFRDISEVSAADDPGYGASAAFGDVDGDGDLDLYVTNYVVFDLGNLPQDGKPCLYEGIPTACGPVGFPRPRDRLLRNDGRSDNGHVRFTDVSEASGIWSVEPEYGLGVVLGDVDGDGHLDVLVGNDSGANFFFRGDGKGHLLDDAWLAGLATQADGRFQAGMGVALGDADGDGRLDAFVTNFALDHNTLYLNQGDAVFRDASFPSGLGAPSRVPMSWGTRFEDFDNDGDLDVFVANGHIYPEVDRPDFPETYRQPNQLFMNDGAGRFREAPESLAPRHDGPQVSRGVASGDIDRDGDVDVVVLEMGTRPTLLTNELNTPGAFVELDLWNRDGTREGARVVVRAAGREQTREATSSGSFCTTSEPRLHIGLKDTVRVDAVDVRWPRGGRQRFEGLAVNRRYRIREGFRQGDSDGAVPSG